MFSSRGAQFALLTLAIPFVVLVNRPLGGDIFWVLSYARVLLADGRLPAADPLTFAPHIETFVDAQWLAQLVYAVPYQLRGLEGVMVFHALTCTAALGAVLHLAWRRSGSPRAAAVSMLLFLPPLLGSVEARAQTLAYLPFVATYWLLQQGSVRWLSLVALATVEVIWTNVHGSFFLGPLLTGVTLVGYVAEHQPTFAVRSLLADRRVRFLVGAGLAQAAATLVTPYGLGMYRYIIELSAHPIIHDAIIEWQPTRIDQLTGLEFFLTLGITAVVLGRGHRRRAPADLLLVAVFGIMGLAASRNVGWWSLVCPPIVAVHLAELRVPLPAWLMGSPSTEQRPLLRGWLGGALVAAGLLFSVPWIRAVSPLAPSSQPRVVDAIYPAGAVDFLLSRPQAGGRLLAHQFWGGYLDWTLWPRYQLMVDPAIELHPPDVWLDYLAIDYGYVAWEQLVDEYKVDALLLSKRKQQPLIAAATRSPNWEVAYTDDVSVVYLRTTPIG